MDGEHLMDKDMVDIQLVLKIMSDKVSELVLQNAVLIAQLDSIKRSSLKNI